MKIKILMVVGTYGNEINGANKQVKILCNILKKEFEFGILYDIFFPIVKPTGDIKHYPFFCNTKFQKYFARFIYYFRVINQYQVIHIHGFSPRNAIIIFLSKFLRKKIILKFTSMGFDDPESILRKNKFLSQSLKLIDYKISPSPAIHNCSLNFFANNKDCLFIPNIARCKKNKQNINQTSLKKGYQILFIGHFSDDKRVSLFIELFIRLYEMKFDIKALIIGRKESGNFEVNESLFPEIQQKLKTNKLEKKVKFIDFVEKIDFAYQESDLLIFPSVREGLPNVVLEAMCHGLPIVSSELKGITDWLIPKDLHSSCLCPIDDIDKFLDKSVNILKNEGLRNLISEKLKVRHKKIHSKFNQEDLYKKIYYDIYGA